MRATPTALPVIRHRRLGGLVAEVVHAEIAPYFRAASYKGNTAHPRPFEIHKLARVCRLSSFLRVATGVTLPGKWRAFDVLVVAGGGC